MAGNMRPYTALVSKLLFPAHELLKSHTTLGIRRTLEKTQWWSADEIAKYQLTRLRALLTEAGKSVPYYRQLFADLNFEPARISGLSDLARLPFLTKPLIRQHSNALKHESATRLTRSNTGGSSGEPLIFWLGLERTSHDVAAKWRATRWWGVDIGDREIVVWGSPIELGMQDRIRQWRDLFFRSSLMPAFEMSPAKLDGFIAEIIQRRPRMLFGYPSALSHIARRAQAQHIAMDGLGIAVAFVTSERLYDDQRQTIEQVFGCPVANGYGGRDAGFIAHQCPAGGMHITAEDIVVEIVDGDGQVLPPGQPGEVVVTHLASREYPFIRYKTGDVAILHDQACACGRGLPMLREISGRTTDFVVAADGTVMHGLALVYVLRVLPGISAFKIIQHSLNHTEVLLVRGDGYLESYPEKIVREFRQRLGAAVEVSTAVVDSIAPEASGKHRFVVSKVPTTAFQPNPTAASDAARDSHA